MNKAKLLLGIVLMVGIAGTSLALKAKKTFGFYILTLDENNVCKKITTCRGLVITPTGGVVHESVYTTTNSVMTTTASTNCTATIRVTCQE